MKKIIAVLLLIFAAAGCSKIPPEPQDAAEIYKQDFCARVSAVCEDENYKMEISKNGTSISFKVVEPEEVAGLSITLCDEHAKLSFMEISAELNTKNLPEKAPFLILQKLFEELSLDDKFVLSTAGDELLAQGTDFAAILNKENLTPKSAVFPEYDAAFEFSDFKIFSAG